MEASEQSGEPETPETPPVETGDVAGDVNVGGETGSESAPEPADDSPAGDGGSEPEEG